MKETIVIVPAYNEEMNIKNLLHEVREAAPDMDIVILNDGSLDRTAQVARESGAKVIDLPCNLGVGGAVQAGFSYAYENGYQYAVRIDGDGQHPPSEIPRLLEAIKAGEADLVIGSRFLGKSYGSTRLRYCGIYLLAQFLSLICRRKVTDPTSGFQVLRRPLLYFFSKAYPMDYPEPEALALMRRQGYDFAEVPAIFRERQAGVSSIQGWGTLYYMLKVFLALIVDRARSVDSRLSRKRVMEAI